jgi:cyclomaltodextrinase
MPNLNFDLSRPGKDEQTTTDIDDADPNWPLVNHVLDMAEFWLSDIDVDGYRLDVAAEIPFWFWELSRKRVKAVKPEAYMAREQRGSSSNLVNGRYFDAVMNYKFFRDHVLALVSKGDMSAPEFDRSLAQGRLVYPEEGAQVMMKPLDSHDTERFLTTAGNDIRRLKLAALFTMTYVGTTTVYYGDEIATTGGSGLDCRRPFYWKWPEESEQVEAHRYFRDLISLRKQHPCFVRGKFETLFAEDMVYAYRRTLPDDEAIVLLNARLNSALVNREVDESVQSLKAAIASVSIPVTAAPAGARFEIAVPALYGFILLPNRDSE